MNKAGRELDSMVAELLGHKRCPNENIDHFVTDDNVVYLCKHYSTNWEDATEAWERIEYNHPLIHKGYRVSLTRIDEKPSVLFEDGLDGFWSEAISGDSYPHAICLAILTDIKFRGKYWSFDKSRLAEDGEY